MNITHAESEFVTGGKLEAIFNRQKELMVKYHDIELKSGLMQTEDCPVNLNDKRGQARIKDFCWRITEEIGEALDAYHDNKSRKNYEHYHEELIDGLHFLTELSILSGINPEELKIDKDSDVDTLIQLYEYNLETSGSKSFKVITEDVGLIIMDLGMMANCLKNKPWKQTNLLTDVEEYFSRLKMVWQDYVRLLSLTLSPDDIVDIYLKKSQVNKFRQRTQY